MHMNDQFEKENKNIVASCCMFLAVFCTTDKKQVTPLLYRGYGV